MVTMATQLGVFVRRGMVHVHTMALYSLDLDEHTLIPMNTALVLSVVQSSCLNLSLLLPPKCDGLSRGATQDVSGDTQIPADVSQQKPTDLNRYKTDMI